MLTYAKIKIFINSIFIFRCFGICKLITEIGLITFLFSFNILLEAEVRVTREAGTFHYGWFCNISVDLNKSKESVKKSSFFIPEFSNAVLSANEIDEIRNQINYMLDAEDDADEEFSSEFSDPFEVGTGDVSEAGTETSETDNSDTSAVSDE